MKKISVIIPVYNTEKLLHKCLDSIVNQTYKNFECIIVDDGSTDNSLKICREYAERDNRFVVLHQENQGQSSARNKALDTATGDYIQFVDSDDWIEPDMMATMFDVAEKNNAEIVRCNIPKRIVERIITKEIFLKEVLKDNVPGWLHSCLFSARLWQDIRLPVGRFVEDASVIHKLILESDNCVIIEKSLYHYYKTNPDNSSNSLKYYYKNTIDRAIMFMDRYYWVQEQKINDEAVESTLIRKATGYIIGALGCYKQYDYSEDDIVRVKKFLKKHFKLIISNSSITFYRKIAVIIICLSSDLYYLIKNMLKIKI